MKAANKAVEFLRSTSGLHRTAKPLRALLDAKAWRWAADVTHKQRDCT